MTAFLKKIIEGSLKVAKVKEMTSKLIGYKFYRHTMLNILHFLTVVIFEQFLSLLLICKLLGRW